MNELGTSWRAMQTQGALTIGVVLLLAAALAAAAWLARAYMRRPRGHGSRLVDAPAFERAVNQAAMQCDQQGTSVCLLWLRVDDFASVNESLGHQEGDTVMRGLSRRLLADTPGLHAASRAPGADFVLLVDGDAAAASRTAAMLQAAVARALSTGTDGTDGTDGTIGTSGSVQLTASIGVAAYPAHGAWRKLPGLASHAMRAVRDGGGDGWAVFAPQMVTEQRERAELLADLRLALDRGEFQLFYQPKVDARTLEVTAAEALLRWVHPRRGLVSPGVFLPLAERHGLIGPLGNWVIDAACAQAGRWRAEGLRMRVAINLSAYQMRQDDMVSRLQQGLQQHRLQPGRFTVEIPESLALEDTLATRHTFERLRRAGLHVAIDDFGAGQTSMAHLHRLPVSELKLDISLVNDLADDDKSRTVTRGLIDIAHGLKLRVVAEGVETAAQRDWLVAAGCDELQGYLFAKPMPAVHLGLWAQGGTSGHENNAGHGFRASLFKETAAAEL